MHGVEAFVLHGNQVDFHFLLFGLRRLVITKQSRAG
jgi:hypothetical protein